MLFRFTAEFAAAFFQPRKFHLKIVDEDGGCGNAGVKQSF